MRVSEKELSPWVLRILTDTDLRGHRDLLTAYCTALLDENPSGDARGISDEFNGNFPDETDTLHDLAQWVQAEYEDTQVVSTMWDGEYPVCPGIGGNRNKGIAIMFSDEPDMELLRFVRDRILEYCKKESITVDSIALVEVRQVVQYSEPVEVE